jgi:hypothetical protein
MDSNQQETITVPKDFVAGRFWARTGCNTNGGQFRCETGDCGPWVDCANGGVQRGGQTPATLAEFTLNGDGNQDYYDISLVDGFNLPMKIIPKSPSAGGNTWCKEAGCVRNLNDICPNELKKFVNGRLVACFSACEKFNQDNYCCRGIHDKPETCKSKDWPVNYPALFKQACPSAYTYAYDDPTSLFFCRNTNYAIEFC